MYMCHLVVEFIELNLYQFNFECYCLVLGKADPIYWALQGGFRI